jgi:hypothetical protein
MKKLIRGRLTLRLRLGIVVRQSLGSVRVGQHFRSGRDETIDSQTFRNRSGDLRGSLSRQCAVRSHQRLHARSVRPSDCASAHGWSGCRILTRIDREIDSCGPGGPPQWRGFDGVSSLSENWPSDGNGSAGASTNQSDEDYARAGIVVLNIE